MRCEVGHAVLGLSAGGKRSNGERVQPCNRRRLQPDDEQHRRVDDATVPEAVEGDGRGREHLYAELHRDRPSGERHAGFRQRQRDAADLQNMPVFAFLP